MVRIHLPQPIKKPRFYGAFLFHTPFLYILYYPVVFCLIRFSFTTYLPLRKHTANVRRARPVARPRRAPVCRSRRPRRALLCRPVRPVRRLDGASRHAVGLCAPGQRAATVRRAVVAPSRWQAVTPITRKPSTSKRVNLCGLWRVRAGHAVGLWCVRAGHAVGLCAPGQRAATVTPSACRAVRFDLDRQATSKPSTSGQRASRPPVSA